MSPADIAEWMTTGQVAAALDVSSTRVIQLADEGRLAHCRIPQGRLFDPEAVAEYQRTRKPKPPKAPRTEKGEWVYFIQAGERGPIKIGWAEVVSTRMAQLQCGSPMKLTLLVAIPGGAARERDLHRRFADIRVRGEWFDGTNETLLAYIEFFRRKQESKADSTTVGGPQL